ncbi:hypothetical protein HDU90_002527 [Geranomyces variabilis]|nr:hypothetical protein HDU90_002527 [Geranomyces variabilis]
MSTSVATARTGTPQHTPSGCASALPPHHANADPDSLICSVEARSAAGNRDNNNNNNNYNNNTNNNNNNNNNNNGGDDDADDDDYYEKEENNRKQLAVALAGIAHIDILAGQAVRYTWGHTLRSTHLNTPQHTLRS